MDKIRVNKITSVFNEDGGVTITLYKTHNKLGQLTSDELGIATFAESGATSKAVYMQYCKDTVTELLKNDGVDGFYYDPTTKGPQAENGYPNKFDRASFLRLGIELVKSRVEECIGNLDITIDSMPTDDGFLPVDIQEAYKDGLLKYATVPIRVILTSDGVFKNLVVPTSIRSGQLCKPKLFIINEIEKSLNQTNIKGLFVEVKASKPKVVSDTPKISIKDGVPKDAELISIENTKTGEKLEVAQIAQNSTELIKSQKEEPKNDTEQATETVIKTDNEVTEGITDEISSVMGMFGKEE
jgi:hypothetical protein